MAQFATTEERSNAWSSSSTIHPTGWSSPPQAVGRSIYGGGGTSLLSHLGLPNSMNIHFSFLMADDM
jgi:hypothetical protein